jgi:hypothetical protein
MEIHLRVSFRIGEWARYACKSLAANRREVERFSLGDSKFLARCLSSLLGRAVATARQDDVGLQDLAMFVYRSQLYA